LGWAVGNDGPASPGAVTIDKQRCCLVVNGKPFFAIGCCGIPPEYMKECAEAGFNLTIRWGSYQPNKKFKAAVDKGEDEARRHLCDYLDAAQAAGLKVVEHPCCFTFDYLLWTDAQFSEKFGRFLKDELPRVASLVKDHPALLAYYSIDDPDLVGDRASWRQQLGQYAAILHQQDPRHPVWLMFCGYQGCARFMAQWQETYDFLGRYAYPIAYRSPFLALLPDTAEYAEIAHQSGKPLWYTPLMEMASGNRGNPLSGDMQAAQVYLNVIGGASGIVWWVWPPRHVDNWRSVKRLAGELRTLTPVLTEPPLATKVIWSPWYLCNTVQARAIRHQGHTWLIAVNPTETPVQVRFKLPQAAGAKAKVWFEDREVPITDGGFTDAFAPLARHIYELDAQWPEQSPIELQVTLEAIPATPAERVSVHPGRNLIPNPGFEKDTDWTFLAEKEGPPQVRGGVQQQILSRRAPLSLHQPHGCAPPLDVGRAGNQTETEHRLRVRRLRPGHDHWRSVRGDRRGFLREIGTRDPRWRLETIVELAPIGPGLPFCPMAANRGDFPDGRRPRGRAGPAGLWRFATQPEREKGSRPTGRRPGMVR
jgi:hypothetical protein